MRIRSNIAASSGYKIIIVDDEISILETLQTFLNSSGHYIKPITNPVEALNEVQNNHYDIMILDFIMYPINGDEVIKRIREFDKELYIILLTGQNDLTSPVLTLKELDIQSYCEKGNNFELISLAIETGIKSVSMMKNTKCFKDKLIHLLDYAPYIYQLQPIDLTISKIFQYVSQLVGSKDLFIILDNPLKPNLDDYTYFKGIGNYNIEYAKLPFTLNENHIEYINNYKNLHNLVISENYLLIPLSNYEYKSIGLIYIESEASILSIEQSLLKVFSTQATSALINSFQYSLNNAQEKNLYD